MRLLPLRTVVHNQLLDFQFILDSALCVQVLLNSLNTINVSLACLCMNVMQCLYFSFILILKMIFLALFMGVGIFQTDL